MGTAILKLKIMPESPETDLGEIKEQGKKGVAEEGGVLSGFEEQPVAFGLKALIATFTWPEEKDTDIAENIFKKIKTVSSVDVIDYRRAFG